MLCITANKEHLIFIRPMNKFCGNKSSRHWHNPMIELVSDIIFHHENFKLSAPRTRADWWRVFYLLWHSISSSVFCWRKESIAINEKLGFIGWKYRFFLSISGSCVHFAQVSQSNWQHSQLSSLDRFVCFSSIFLGDFLTFRMCPRYSWREKLCAALFLSRFIALCVHFEARFSFFLLGSFFLSVFHRCKSLCSVAFCHFASFSTKTKVRLVYLPSE